MRDPALGMLEFKSVARGIFATDAMVKKAPVKILATNPICPGKYMTIIGGEVGDVDEAVRAGEIAGGDLLINKLFLPHVHHSIIPSITGTTKVTKFGALAILEAFSVTSCVCAADIAVKAAQVELIEMRLANGLGGKGYFVMTGELTDIEYALKMAVEFVKGEGMLASSVVIPSPHKELLEKGVYW